jgi:hypothetical protein
VQADFDTEDAPQFNLCFHRFLLLLSDALIAKLIFA